VGKIGLFRGQGSLAAGFFRLCLLRISSMMRATFETFSFWSESVRALTGNNFFCLLPSLSNPKSYTIIKDHFYKMWIYSIFELLFL
jgi:hypothetical protein